MIQIKVWRVACGDWRVTPVVGCVTCNVRRVTYQLSTKTRVTYANGTMSHWNWRSTTLGARAEGSLWYRPDPSSSSHFFL